MNDPVRNLLIYEILNDLKHCQLHKIDIFKPFPVSYFDENFKNGIGIVMDDLIAGAMAIIPSYIILTLLV